MGGNGNGSSLCRNGEGEDDVCVCVKWKETCERGILYVDKKKFRAHLKMG